MSAKSKQQLKSALTALNPQVVVFEGRDQARITLGLVINLEQLYDAINALEQLPYVDSAEFKLGMGAGSYTANIEVTFSGSHRGGGLSDKEGDQFTKLVRARYQGIVTAHANVVRNDALMHAGTVVTVKQNDGPFTIGAVATASKLSSVAQARLEPEYGHLKVTMANPSASKLEIDAFARYVAEQLGYLMEVTTTVHDTNPNAAYIPGLEWRPDTPVAKRSPKGS